MAPLGLPPLDVLLSWPLPNYVNPITRGSEAYAIGTIFFGFATVALAIRLYARLFIRKWFGLDDFLIVLAWLSTVGVQTSVYIGTMDYGWDRHIWDTKIQWLQGSGKMFWLSSLFWAFSSSFIRLSLLCFYYRLVEHIRIRRYVWMLHTLMAISIGLLIAYILTLAFMCLPVGAFNSFPYSAASVKCIDYGVFIFIITIINTLMELTLALLPLPVIFSLDLTKRQRWTIASVLSLGVLIFVVGVVRTYFVYKCLLDTWDMTWWATPQWICSEVENNLALICACLPALRPIAGRIFTKPSQRSKQLTHKPRRPMKPFPTLNTREKMEYSSESLQGWFDLEGIADDGLGYSVNIIAGKAEHKNRKYRLRRVIIDQIESASTFDSSTKSQKLETIRTDSQQSMLKDNKFPPNILTRQSVEVRESFHEKSYQRNFNDRNFTGKETSWSNEGIHGRSESANSESPSVTSTKQTELATVAERVASHGGYLKAQPRFSPVLRPSSRESPRIGGPLRPLNSSQWWASPSR